MVARISNKDYQTLKNIAELRNPKAWIRGDLSIKNSSKLGFFWWIAKNCRWIQKIFYSLNIKKSEKSLANLRARIIQAENTAGNPDQNLRKLFNACLVNFQTVSRINKPALAALKLQTTAKKVHNLTVGSYNILFPQTFPHTHCIATAVGYHENEQGELVDNSAYRIRVISQNIRNADLDVNCLQEVSKAFFETLKDDLGDKYAAVWAPHNGNMPEPGSSHQVNNDGSIFNPKPNKHGVALFYKKDQFNMLQSYANFFKNDKIRKRHLMVDLQDKTTGLVTRFATCHLTDPRQWTGQNKTQHIDVVLKDAHRDYKVDMIVVAGDMNQDQFGDLGANMPDLLSATAFQPLVTNGYKHGAENLDPKSFPSTEIKKADNDYSLSGKLVSTGRMIDHIFMKSVNPGIKPTIKLAGVPENFDEKGSDHRIIVSVISI